MVVPFKKPVIDLLRESSEKLISEDVDFFGNIASISTEKEFICTTIPSLEKAAPQFIKMVADFFDKNLPDGDEGVRFGIELNTTTGVHSFDVIGVSTKNANGKEKSATDIAFTLFHEMAHLTDNKYTDEHMRETYANTLAYLLFAREVGKANLDLLTDKPFAKSFSALKEYRNGESGLYYSTEAMLAAKHLISEIDLENTNLTSLKEIAEECTDKFSIVKEKRIDLFNKTTKAIIVENRNLPSCKKLLQSLLKTDDHETYRAYRYMSLSNEFNEALNRCENNIEDIEFQLTKKDKEMNFILDPILARKARP